MNAVDDSETPPTEQQPEKSLRGRCWASAFNAFATAFMFERRSARYRRQLRLLAFVAIGIPLLIGAMVRAYGATSTSVAAMLPYVAGLGVVQLVVSLWSLIADWSGGLQQSCERIWVNHELARNFEGLARTPPPDLQRQFDLLLAEEKVSERTDYQLHLTDAEKRTGYRAASRQFRRACATCGQTAHALEPSSDCPTCGEPSRFWSKHPDWHKLPSGDTSPK